MQRGRDDANRGFYAMDAGADFAEMRERGDEPDGAVAAHAEISDVVEEDDARGAASVDWFAEEGADDDI